MCALWRRRTGQSLGAKAVPSLPGKWPSDLGEIDPVTEIEILTVEETATRLKVKTSWVYTLSIPITVFVTMAIEALLWIKIC